MNTEMNFRVLKIQRNNPGHMYDFELFKALYWVPSDLLMRQIFASTNFIYLQVVKYNLKA